MKTVINYKNLTPTKALEKDIFEKSKPLFYAQECPYSTVKLEYNYNGRYFRGVEFSKVSFPDVWDEKYGYDLAITRAVRSIRKQIQEYVKQFALPLSA